MVILVVVSAYPECRQIFYNTQFLFSLAIRWERKVRAEQAGILHDTMKSSVVTSKAVHSLCLRSAGPVAPKRSRAFRGTALPRESTHSAKVPPCMLILLLLQERSPDHPHPDRPVPQARRQHALHTGQEQQGLWNHPQHDRPLHLPCCAHQGCQPHDSAAPRAVSVVPGWWLQAVRPCGWVGGCACVCCLCVWVGVTTGM